MRKLFILLSVWAIEAYRGPLTRGVAGFGLRLCPCHVPGIRSLCMSPGDENNDNEEEDEDSNEGEFAVDGFKGALIAEDDSRPSWEEFK